MTNNALNPDSGRSAEHAYQSIRDQILSGEQPGGQWLREGDLAAVIGVSRTPVREALRQDKPAVIDVTIDRKVDMKAAIYSAWAMEAVGGRAIR